LRLVYDLIKARGGEIKVQTEKSKLYTKVVTRMFLQTELGDLVISM